MTKILIRRKKKNKEETFQQTPELESYDLKLFTNYYFINNEIFELLKQEEFFLNMNEKVKNKIEYQILIGNNRIMIKNKALDEENLKYYYTNEYLVYIDRKETIKYIDDEDLQNNNDDYILYYILNYSKNKFFFNDLKILNNKNGLKEYILKRNIVLNNINIEEDIKDIDKNIIGAFINIRINEDYIKKVATDKDIYKIFNNKENEVIKNKKNLENNDIKENKEKNMDNLNDINIKINDNEINVDEDNNKMPIKEEDKKNEINKIHNINSSFIIIKKKFY